MGTLQGRDLADVGLDRCPHVVAVRLQEEDLATVQAGKDQGLAAAGLRPSQGTILRPARGGHEASYCTTIPKTYTPVSH